LGSFLNREIFVDWKIKLLDEGLPSGLSSLKLDVD